MYGHFAARIVWHRLFDPTQKLLAILEPDSSRLLVDFMRYCYQRKIGLDWKKHIAFLSWMIDIVKFKPINQSFIRMELIAATASSWAYDQYANSDFQRIVIFDKFTNTCVGATRSTDFSKPIKISLLSHISDSSSINFCKSDIVYGLGIGSGWSIFYWHSF